MCLSLNKNTQRFVTGSRDFTLKLWDIRGGKTVKTLEGHSDWVKCCLLDGDNVISGSSDSTVRQWNLNSDGKGVKAANILQGHTGTVNSLMVNSNMLLSSSADGSTRVWDLKTGSYLTSLVGHQEEVIGCQLVQTNSCITASHDSTLRIWDLSRLKENHSPPVCVSTLFGHQFRISSMEVYENKVVSGSFDKTVKVWEWSHSNRFTS